MILIGEVVTERVEMKVNNLHCGVLVKLIVPILLKFGTSEVNYIYICKEDRDN